MKKLLIITIIMLIAVSIMLFTVIAQASPWIVCDPQEADGYVWSMDGGPWVEQAYELYDSTCAKVADLDGLATGQHSIQVKAFKVDPVWGRQESEVTPLDFARPAVGKSLNMGLKK